MNKRIPFLLISLLYMFAISGHCSSLPFREISQSKYCDSIPESVASSCKDNKGAKSPFRYAIIKSIDDCNLIVDSGLVEECRSKQSDILFYVDTKKLAKGTSLSKVPDETMGMNINRLNDDSPSTKVALYLLLAASIISLTTIVYKSSHGM